MFKISKRKARNRRLTCYCCGWWFPHRIGSRASLELIQRIGAAGCPIHPLDADLYVECAPSELLTNGLEEQRFSSFPGQQ